jgi:hypothetical protein
MNNKQQNQEQETKLVAPLQNEFVAGMYEFDLRQALKDCMGVMNNEEIDKIIKEELH